MPGNEGLSEGLRIEINVDPKDAQKGLDSLVETLGKLQGAVDKATGAVQKFNTSQFSGEMKKLSTAMKPLRDFKATADSALSGLNSFIQSANSIGQESDSTEIVDYITGIASAVSLLADAGKQLRKPLESLGSLGAVVQELSSVMEGSELSEGIAKLTEALAPLGDVAKGDFDKVLTQLKRFPDIAKGLSDADLDQFAQQVKQLADALKPLAVELEKVAAGFQSLPKGITGASKAVGGFEMGVSSLGKGLKIAGLAVALRKTSKVMSEWVKISNDYVENLNLFRVAMGDAADEALDYAEKVQGAFGIDPSEWIRFQSVFQNMVTGFGIAGEKASGMSKTLTQLGYDLSTLFNVDYETAMRKLQSAIAGQPRPMREWGFDLSETTLKLTALKHGIEENVETMTQYEKSQLRFMQIMDTAQKQGVLGNFAREIYTPANAMRILQQQIVQLKRALGNLLIPMLMKVLPYLQAFVIIVTDAIRALGVLVGFTLPTIDYSGLGGSVGEVGDGLEEIETGAEGANAAAKKLQSTLLGFDELNIVSEPAAAGGGGGGVGVDIGGGSGLDFDLSEYDYDFLGDAKMKALDLVDSFYEKFAPVLTFVKEHIDDIWEIVKAIGISFLAWKIAKGVLDFFGMEAIKSGQVAMGIALMFAGFKIGANAIANIALGEGELFDYIALALSSAAIIGGALLAFGATPAGLLLSLGFILAMVVTGMDLAYKKGIDNIIKGVMESEGDTLITELAKAFSKAMSEITITFNPVIKAGDNLRKFAEEADGYRAEIENLFIAITTGVDDSAEAFVALNEAMHDFTVAVQNMSDEAYTNVITAISVALIDAADDAKVGWTELLDTIYLVRAEGDAERADRIKRLEELNKGFADGKVGLDEFKQSTLEIYAEIAKGEIAVLDASISFDGLLSSLGKIDWQSEAERAEAFEEIGTSVKRTKEKTEEYLQAFTDSIPIILADIHDPELRAQVSEALYLFRDDQRAELERKMGGNVSKLYGAIQVDMVTKIEEVGKKAGEEWENMSNAQKRRISKSEYARDAINAFRDNYIKPVAQEMNAHLESFGLEGSNAMIEASDRISNAIFSEEITGAPGGQVSPIRNIEEHFDKLSYFTKLELEYMKEILPPIAKDAGKEITDGVSKGITDGKEGVQNSVDELVGGVSTNLKEAVPPVGKKAGGDVVDHLGKAIADGKGEVNKSVSGLLDGVASTVRSFKMPKIAIEFDVKAPSISSHGGLTLGKTITAYADGGYPDVGEMFIAREAGPEMVGTIGGRTAVATNADIVDGVAKGVYAAVKAATPKSDGGSSVHEVRVYLDGREISANVEKHRRERGRVMLSGGVV